MGDLEPRRRVRLRLQPAERDDAATVRAAVAATGRPELRGLPDTAAGFARALVRLRDAHAPNVRLAYHLSDWGTRSDLHLNRPDRRQTAALAARAAAFERSLGARFDLLFTDWADADAGFEQRIRGDGGASWWRAGDFTRATRFLAGVVRGTGLRAVVWQLPLGNTVRRAMDDSWGHFRDNRVQTLLDGPRRRVLRGLARAGVVGLLFGAGVDGATEADGDGGYFAAVARRYARDPLRLP